jgi:hypothetical protein
LTPEEPASLDDLLARLEELNPYERMQRKDDVAARGTGAIPAMRAWLCDRRRDGLFAAVVLREIGRAGEQEPAIAALLDGARCANDRVRGHIANALSTFGIALEEPPGAVGRVAPSYMKPTKVVHVLVDLVRQTGTSWGDVYLTACGWAYAGETLRKMGGPTERDGRSICAACQNAEARAR